jgi:hypothetical protein
VDKSQPNTHCKHAVALVLWRNEALEMCRTGRAAPAAAPSPARTAPAAQAAPAEASPVVLRPRPATVFEVVPTTTQSGRVVRPKNLD